MRSALRYAFVELATDIGPWLLLGIGLSGLITALIPDGFIENFLGQGFMSMLVMLAVGIPIFVCDTASTPVVAALALKGLSPGAALVFLLAGPATNAATLTVLPRILGRRGTVVYLVVIALASLALGMAVNALYGLLGLSVSGWAGGAGEAGPGVVAWVSALMLVGMVCWGRLPRRKPPCPTC